MENQIIITAPSFSVKKPGRRRGKAIICMDTGETFTSAKAVCDKEGLIYTTFVYRCNRGYHAEDGRLYLYVADLAYHANDIKNHIYENARLRYVNAKMKLHMLEQQQKEIQAEMDSLQRLVGQKNETNVRLVLFIGHLICYTLSS